MAVYTQLEFDEIETLVAPLRLGRLLAAEGVAAGVENTTYFLDFAPTVGSNLPSQYVLTITESLSKYDLKFVAILMHDLNARGLPVPPPAFSGHEFDCENAILLARGKPAILVPKIAGEHPRSITATLCRQIGQTLAALHQTTLTLGYGHISHRSLDWVITTAKTLLPHVETAERSLLNNELESLTRFVSTDNELPQAIIHGDLFRDNVLFKQGNITAIIDFFSAGTGYLLLDLAIVVNDWCFDARGRLNTPNYNELISSYCKTRNPTAAEIASWRALLRIAALRFWVSRLSEQLLAGPHTPRGRGKDPEPYRQLVLHHHDSPLQLEH